MRSDRLSGDGDGPCSLAPGSGGEGPSLRTFPGRALALVVTLFGLLAFCFALVNDGTSIF